MKSKKRVEILIGLVIFLIIVIISCTFILNKFKANNEIIDLKEYYNIDEKEALVFLHGNLYDKKAMIIDGNVYLDYDTVNELFNEKMYWDSKENILTYTTPNEIIQAEAGKDGYMVSKNMIKSKIDLDYDIIKLFVDKVYVAMNFVESHSNIKYRFYQDPNRLMVSYIWEEFLHTDTLKDTVLRVDPNIKSPIVKKLELDTVVQLIDLDMVPAKGYTKVITEDGIIGYVKNKDIRQSYYKKEENTYKELEYTSISRSNKINLVFHQVFNDDSSSNLESLISETKGVTTVSPTWFSVTDNEGNISSLADEKYVKKANQLNLEVWGLVDDFSENVNMYELLSYTSRRENLANNLIEKAIQYKLNGINIDFEKISKDCGIHYIQFIRELSVKCRNNGIILSVDTYVPSAYTQHYFRQEQGEVVDYLIVMAYDEHYAGSQEAGSVASIGFVKDAVNNILELVEKDKVIIALPFYTRVWKEENSVLTAESYAMTPTINFIKDHEIETIWDNETGQFYGEITKEGITYKVWQEEDKSIEEKLKVVYAREVAGIGFWKLGLEKESIWNIVLKYLN